MKKLFLFLILLWAVPACHWPLMTAFAQVSAKAGQFAKSTGGAPASQAVTGVGFVPKVLFLTTIAGSRISNGNHNDATITLGVITASGEESAATWGSGDNGATMGTGFSGSSTRVTIGKLSVPPNPNDLSRCS